MFFLENYFNLFLILFFSCFYIFIIGLTGIFLSRSNLILFLISLELIIISLVFLVILWSIYLDDFLGYFFAYFLLVIAATESTIGLAFLVIFYRLNQTININYLYYIKS